MQKEEISLKRIYYNYQLERGTNMADPNAIFPVRKLLNSQTTRTSKRCVVIRIVLRRLKISRGSVLFRDNLRSEFNLGKKLLVT